MEEEARIPDVVKGHLDRYDLIFDDCLCFQHNLRLLTIPGLEGRHYVLTANDTIYVRGIISENIFQIPMPFSAARRTSFRLIVAGVLESDEVPPYRIRYAKDRSLPYDETTMELFYGVFTFRYGLTYNAWLADVHESLKNYVVDELLTAANLSKIDASVLCTRETHGDHMTLYAHGDAIGQMKVTGAASVRLQMFHIKGGCYLNRVFRVHDNEPLFRLRLSCGDEIIKLQFYDVTGIVTVTYFRYVYPGHSAHSWRQRRYLSEFSLQKHLPVMGPNSVELNESDNGSYFRVQLSTGEPEVTLGDTTLRPDEIPYSGPLFEVQSE